MPQVRPALTPSNDRPGRLARRGAGVSACLLALVAGIALWEGDRNEAGRAAGPDVAVTVAPPTSPSTTAVADPSTCRNSYNASCGPFRWQPAPPAVPIEVRVRLEPASPRVGQAVTFNVEVRRERGAARPVLVESGDGGVPEPDSQLGCPQPGERARYGPWDLPADRPFEYSVRYTWVYRAPGTYTARFSFGDWACGMYAPAYPGGGEASVLVSVPG